MIIMICISGFKKRPYRLHGRCGLFFIGVHRRAAPPGGIGLYIFLLDWKPYLKLNLTVECRKPFMII